ncbi:MAG TPA: ATP-binding protein [Myxococcales bacterium]
MEGTGTQPPDSAGARSLTELLHGVRAEVLARWKEALRDCSPARRFPEPELVDHLPAVLSQVLDRVASAGFGGAHPAADEAKTHAHVRLAAGLGLNDILTELFLLRHVLLDFAHRRGEPLVRTGDAQAIGWAIDAAIRSSVDASFVEEHRTLRALDRLAAASLESRTLDDLLKALLVAVAETAEEVDALRLLLADGDALRLRAAVGLERGLTADLQIRSGEGLAGQVAQARRPLGGRASAHDPLLRGSREAARLRGAYAVPLVSEGRLIGVLAMASLTAEDFSERDRTLLRAIADRAAAAIVQQQLREDAARLAARSAEALAVLGGTYAAAPVGLAVLDRELRFARVNEVAAAIGGIPPEQHLGKRLSELFPGVAEIERIEALCRQVMQTGTAIADVELAGLVPGRPDRRAVILESFYPVRAGQEVVGVGLVLRDVTEERAAKDYQQHVLGIVSHDLRTPLCAISLSATTLLRDPGLPERAVRTAGRIKSSADRMEQIVRDLLDFTRVRAGQPIPLEVRPVDLLALCRQAVEEAGEAHPGRALSLRGSGSDARGEWDPGRISQAVSNLLANALTHGAPGTPVDVRVEGRPGSVIVEVANQGPPIDPGILPHLFEPFRRGETGPAQRGLGLGLFIARELVHRHGGSLEVRSDERETAFRITLPRR